MKTSEKLKLRLDDCGFECEGDNGTLVEEVALLEDALENIADMQTIQHIMYAIQVAKNALAKLELLK